MTPLVRFLLINLAGVQSHGSAGLFADQPLAAAMVLCAGAVGTGLALLAHE